MHLKYETRQVIGNHEVEKNVYKLTVEGDFSANPGQFYMIKSWRNEPILSRPISIHDIDHRGISFLYEVRGEGTGLLRQAKQGSTVELLGPLGNGFNTDSIGGKVAFVCGGIGIAPVLYTLKKANKGLDIDIYAGFREHTYGIDELKDYSKNVFIATNNGSRGHRGFITDIFSPLEYSAVFCCGPRIMMAKVAEVCNKYATPSYISMENFMACGIGACLVCTCETIQGNKRTCKDGPVFSGREVRLYA